MKAEDKTMRFLLGANTPQGFVSRFDRLVDEADGWRAYIIKGGPGSGKSTMMSKIADNFKGDPGLEMIHCSADMDSLDAVIVPSRKFFILDGNPPHVIEPKYPGAASSLVDFTSCFDEDKLDANRAEITALTDSISNCHEYSCRFLSAAQTLAGDSCRLALDSVKTHKLTSYLGRLAEKEFRQKKTSPGKEKVRFLTAVTNKGVVKFAESAKKLASRIYLISDDPGAVSRLMLHRVRADALACGYDIISCYCTLEPYDKLEQLFIPELDVGFMTSNRYHSFELEIDPYRMINCQRFTDNEKLKSGKRRFSFNRKASAQMISQAVELIQEAQKLHAELEGYYSAATDFAKVDLLTQNLIEKLESRKPGS